ncbi:MAG: thioredoxin family protein [Lachnospiraceae bacterium]|nr:thioredoxin family protein [Lachnospiraceae bacterium]
MALFGKKKEEEKKTPACSEAENGICSIKVLGSGCASCHAQYENAKEAVQKMGFALEVEYVTDLQKIMEYGVMSMPALVVNEKVVSMGKVLKASDVEKLLHKLGL